MKEPTRKEFRLGRLHVIRRTSGSRRYSEMGVVLWEFRGRRTLDFITRRSMLTLRTEYR